MFGALGLITQDRMKKKKCLALFFTERNTTRLAKTAVLKSLYYSKSWHTFASFKILEIHFFWKKMNA